MSTKSVDIKVSEELMPYIYTFHDGNTVNEKFMLSSVVGMFAAKIITLEKAAELLDKSIWDFMDILKSYQIPWGDYTEEDMEMDNQALNKIAGGLYE